MSCSVCATFHSEAFGPPEWPYNDVDLGSVARNVLQEAADSGCQFCGLVIQGLVAYDNDAIFDQVRVVSQPVSCVGNTQFGQHKRLSVRAHQGEAEVLKVEMYTDDSHVTAEWPAFAVSSHVSKDAFSETCVSQGRQWLSQCLKAHDPKACARNTHVELPTRLIDVQHPLTNLRLRELPVGTRGSYAALSYCWGTDKTFTTTSKNYARLQEGFELKDLPKTCRDAVVVARALNIPYLWIDRLCIKQDSTDDWQCESSRMCSVYRNACVTLAALDAVGCDQGLFLPREDWWKARLECELSDGSKSSVFVRRLSSRSGWGGGEVLHRRPKITGRAGSSRTKNTLNTRGWTLQEVTLSTRILWFSDSELAWSCLSAAACECYPDFDEYHKREQQTNALFRMMDSPEGVEWDIREYRRQMHYMPVVPMQRMKLWEGLVREFSRRQMSHPRDRLPALAGLAAAFLNRSGDQYVAGMWKQHLVTQLLWSVDRRYRPTPNLPYRQSPSEEHCRQMVGYCPTWSWCSALGGIHWRWAHNCQPSWTIEDVSYHPAGLNPFGHGSGVLKIHGSLLALKKTGFKFVLDNDADGGDGNVVFCQGGEFTPDAPGSIRSRAAAARGRTVYFLFAGNGMARSRVCRCVGLLLDRVSSSPAQYERLGLINIWVQDKEDGKAWQESWLPHSVRTTVTLT